MKAERCDTAAERNEWIVGTSFDSTNDFRKEMATRFSQNQTHGLLSRGGLSQVRLVKKATDSSRFSQKVRSRRPLSRMRLGHAHCECVSIYGVPNRTV